ncbi:MAG: hypothetical protein JNM13_00435 [Hyphomicrobiaceae bacterium]|nr:hypothetical protein [Hyphomicrobiaceae bacterium]
MSDATIIMLIGMAGWAIGFTNATIMWRAVADLPEMRQANALNRGWVMVGLVSTLPAGHPGRAARWRAILGFLVFLASIVVLLTSTHAGATP